MEYNNNFRLKDKRPFKRSTPMRWGRRTLNSDKNDSTISSIKKDYDRNVLDEQNKLEIQLTKVRNRNEQILESEKERYNRMVEELKMNNETQIAELRQANESEYQSLNEEHQESLEDARAQYEAQLAKYEA